MRVKRTQTGVVGRSNQGGGQKWPGWGPEWLETPWNNTLSPSLSLQDSKTVNHLMKHTLKGSKWSDVSFQRCFLRFQWHINISSLPTQKIPMSPVCGLTKQSWWENEAFWSVFQRFQSFIPSLHTLVLSVLFSSLLKFLLFFHALPLPCPSFS